MKPGPTFLSANFFLSRFALSVALLDTQLLPEHEIMREQADIMWIIKQKNREIDFSFK